MRRELDDPGISLRKRRAWFADEVDLEWKSGRPDKEVPAIYEFYDQVLKEKFGIDKLYVGSTRMMHARMGEHKGTRLLTYEGIRYFQLPENISPTHLKILEQIRILQYGGVENLANSYKLNGERYVSNPINIKKPSWRAEIRKFVQSNPYGLPEELLRLPPDF